MYSVTVTQVNVKTIKRIVPFTVADNIADMSTLECILRNRNRSHIIALNFANALFPGGGYVLGGNAQEESLCRSTLLYYTIRTQKNFYLKNLLHVLPDYTDTLIYSGNVPVIRNQNDKLLKNPCRCDFITCPAVNRRFAKFMFHEICLAYTMKRRIEKIAAFAVSKKPDLIILGAFGCGAFGNDPKTVFKTFEEAINKCVPDDIDVIFAVPGGLR